MIGVYGTFVEHFTELNERCECWNKEDASDKWAILAIYMPSEGSGIKRRKYTSGNTGLDVTESDDFYVSCQYDEGLQEGTYIRRLNHPSYVYRLTKDLGFEKAAGYHVFTIERVTGTTIDKQEPLKVKEAVFD